MKSWATLPTTVLEKVIGMSTKSRIEWTEQTWNPAVGCTKVSPGCAHCYAEVMARRLQAMGVNGYDSGFALTLLPERLEEPLRRKRSTVYFVNSMSDLFHEEIPFIRKVFRVIAQAPQHTFQILTKRAERMATFLPISVSLRLTPGWGRPWKIANTACHALTGCARCRHASASSPPNHYWKTSVRSICPAFTGSSSAANPDRRRG